MSRKFTVTTLLALGLLLTTPACDDGDSLPPSATLMDAQVPTDAGVDDAGPPMQAVTLRFKAKLGAADLVCGQNYAAQGATQREATPQDFRFFVQEAYLLDASGNEVRVEFDDGLPFQTKDVALIDFTDAAGACGNAGGATTNLEIRGKVPRGTYNGVVFVNGVPDPLNHGNPALAPQPLRAPGASWEWLNGYRFVMAELAPPLAMMDGGVPAPASGDAGIARASSVHVGSTGCTGMVGSVSTVTCAKANRNRVRLPSFDPAMQSIVADLSSVFSGVDLAQGSQCHGTGASCAAGYAALGVDPQGQPSTTQQVFRVE